MPKKFQVLHFKSCSEVSFKDQFVVSSSSQKLMKDAVGRVGAGAGSSCILTQQAPQQVRWWKFHGKRDQAGQRYGLSRAAGAEGSRNVLKSTSKRNHSAAALTRAPLNTMHHSESSWARSVRPERLRRNHRFEDDAGALGGRHCSIMQIAALFHLECAEICL